MNEARYRALDQPNGCLRLGGRCDSLLPMISVSSLPESARLCTLSESIEAECVIMNTTNFTTATITFANSAAMTAMPIFALCFSVPSGAKSWFIAALPLGCGRLRGTSCAMPAAKARRVSSGWSCVVIFVLLGPVSQHSETGSCSSIARERLWTPVVFMRVR